MRPRDIDVADLERPRPKITPTSRPYWEGLREHRLVLQRCRGCAAWVHYPRVRCPSCGSGELGFDEVDPAATVHAFTVARQPTAPHFRADVPQVIAIVELANGVRMTATLDTADPATVAVGDAVEAVFDDGPDGITMLRYRPVNPPPR